MTLNLVSPKFILLYIFLASVLYVHFRGRVRHPFMKQLVDHSGLLSPYNTLLYLFSAVPSKPYLDLRRFPELDTLTGHWQMIRDEALKLFDEGYIKAAAKNNDAAFGSFFKKGWKRFYLKWYGRALPSAETLCPKTVELVNSIPNVKAAMFALLPPGSKLDPHRDPFASSLRYHLGLATPNDDACKIIVDGQPYSWRDGQAVMFDETFVHEAENGTQQTRLILFCDIERPLHTPLVRGLNRIVSRVLGSATATQNVEGERVGIVNRLFIFAYHMGQARRRFKRFSKPLYNLTKVALAAGVIYLILR